MLRARLDKSGCPPGHSPHESLAPEGHSGATRRDAGDELLAAAVARELTGTRYEIAAAGYARLTRPLRRLVLPTQLPQGIWPFVSRPAEERRRPPGEPVASVVLFDIESLGFIGRPLFLIGAVHGRHVAGELWDLEMVQYLARDYAEEEAILTAFREDASRADLCVSFNGRTFDLPFLELRAAYYRQEPYRPRQHLDLLPVARRCWGARLPNCRLKTLEHLICGRPRAGLDIDSARVPEAYHRFVRTGEPFELLEVLGHNATDLTSLLELHARAAAELGRETTSKGDAER